MKRFYGFENYKKNKPVVLVLGMFDGIHKGHKALFDKAFEVKSNKNTAVLTFFGAFKHNDELFSKDEKEEALEQLGLDEAIFLDIKPELRNTSWQDFIKLIKQYINPVAVVVGFDYTFGKDALGKAKMLEQEFEKVYIVEKVETGGVKVSSTALRECVSKGDMEAYNVLSVFPFYVMGVVVHGNGLGAKNSTPTLNIAVDNHKLMPPDGVYAVSAEIEGKEYKAIANLGNAPTFNRNERILEVHVLNFKKNIYGEKVKINFYKRIRDVKKFETLRELYKQIEKDIDFVNNISLTN